MPAETTYFYPGDRVLLADTLTCTGTVVATTETQATVEWDAGYTGSQMFWELEPEGENE